MVRPLTPAKETESAVVSALGEQVTLWAPVSGGYSAAGLWVIETTVGRRLFVKAATTDLTARFLRDEMVVYGAVQAAYLPEVEAWVDDGHRPLLILEDLSDSFWPPPWTDEDVRRVWGTCEAIAATAPPPGLTRTASMSGLGDVYWPAIADDPRCVVALGVAPSAWLADVLPALVAAEAGANLSGSSLVHADIRSDNVCVRPRVRVVDWNWAFAGNPALDLVGWLPSLHLEGGPAPWELMSGEPGLVTRLAGYWLHYATKPVPDEVRGNIREFQRAQGAVALEWAARELDLPRPA
jgi:hypothetical protein